MLEEVLARGRRRLLANTLISRIALGACVYLGAFVLLLILGTKILNWWIPVLLGFAVLTVGLVQMLRHAPTETNVAHVLDTGWGLSDALATAVYFRGSGRGSAAVQRRQAEQEAERIDLAEALPYRWPRSLSIVTGLAVAACALVVVRYGATHTLSLTSPIVPFNLDPFAPDTHANNQEANRKPGVPKLPPDHLLTRLGDSTADNPNAADLRGQSDSAVTNSGRESKDALNGAAAEGKKDGSAGQSTNSSDANADNAKEGGDQSPSSRDGEQQGAQAANKTPGSSASSGLMSKLKDAVSSLMSKMKPQGGQNPPNGSKQETQQANAKQQQGQQSGQKQGQQGDKGSPSQQEGDESAATDSDQSAPGQGKGKSSDQNAAAKPGSGMGHQDGSKELKDAEQLAAMGKLSEIIGKRSANITGEMTIESQSGPQQLKTGYTHSSAKHGESGGDVSRDEVPVALQGYVQQYFEQVRKQATGKSARAGKVQP